MAKKQPKPTEELVHEILTAVANDEAGQAVGIVMQETATYNSKQSEAGMRAVQNIIKNQAQLTQCLEGTYNPPKRQRAK